MNNGGGSVVFGDAALQALKNDIEAMNKDNQVKVLKILCSGGKTKINKNKSGVFVNMSYLPEDVLVQMQEFNEFVKQQELELVMHENQKRLLENIFFVGGGGGGSGGCDNGGGGEGNSTSDTSSSSSSALYL